MNWVQWLAVTGGPVAAVTLAVSRRDSAASDADGVYVDVTGFQPAPAPPGTPMLTRYRIVNDGRLPASAVGISAWGWGRRRLLWRIRRHRNWMTGRRITNHVYPTVMAHSATDEEILPGLRDEGPVDERPPVMLVFRDGRGRTWVRWPDGKLTRLAPSLFQLEKLWNRRP